MSCLLPKSCRGQVRRQQCQPILISSCVNAYIYTCMCSTFPVNIQKYKKENTRNCDLGCYHLFMLLIVYLCMSCLKGLNSSHFQSQSEDTDLSKVFSQTGDGCVVILRLLLSLKLAIILSKLPIILRGLSFVHYIVDIPLDSMIASCKQALQQQFMSTSRHVFKISQKTEKAKLA